MGAHKDIAVAIAQAAETCQEAGMEPAQAVSLFLASWRGLDLVPCRCGGVALIPDSLGTRIAGVVHTSTACRVTAVQPLPAPRP